MEAIKKGAFKAELMKNFRQLKESRAESVAEDVEIIYKRKIEDLCRESRNDDRQRENLMLDLAPTTAMSNAVVPADFNPETFWERDLSIGLHKRETIIMLEIQVERYERLFGPFPDAKLIKQVLPGWTSLYTADANDTEEEA